MNGIGGVANLLHDLPDARAAEVVETLLTGRGIRLQRIVSWGQCSPPDFWYEQDEAEWIMVVAGAARLQVDGDVAERALKPGDTLFLPARCRHRVAWTDPTQPTVWLALFVAPDVSPST